jgi:aminopeptidase N
VAEGGSGVTEELSLTRDEAIERAGLISVDRYDIAVDLTDLAEGDAFRAVSTIRFGCNRPGASTFVDCVADVESATLNGEQLPADAVADGRVELSGLRADNTLVVSSVQRQTQHGAGVRRCVDSSDKLVYVWTTFEPDDARRVWACFDQPDLKARFAFTVTAPENWTVTSNSAAPTVETVGDARRWTFPDTPPLSTYVPVVNAGPFYEVRRQIGGYDLGLYTRQSLAANLDRDAAEIFALTAAGLEFFGEQFAQRFPEPKYDQVFIPDMGGAMENWGCVTWSDMFVFRAPPTPAERELRALVLLHEMAHMWFGDLVTMKWWDDLWLNEAFAEWACHWAAVNATEFTDAWAGFLAGSKLAGYGGDMSPATHPIRQPARDVAEAAASFDNITYPKGASVLKQLTVYVGEAAFVAGLRAYFAEHAYGNTELSDLIGALELASGRDLSAWTTGWLDTAGTDRLVLDRDDAGSLTLRATGPDGSTPRPHRLGVGVYDDEGGELIRRELLDVETQGVETRLGGDIAGDLLLVNDDDLTFASTRPDSESRSTLFSRAAELPSSVSRAVAVTTAWDMLVTGDASAAEFVECVTSVLPSETADPVVEPFLRLAITAAELWSPDDRREQLTSSVADACLTLVDAASRRQVAVRGLARTAVTDEQLARLHELAGDDVDLRWRELIRLAELGAYDADEVAALDRRDPNPDAWARALAVSAARPDAGAKEEVWVRVVDKHDIPVESLGELSLAFWRPGQALLLQPYAQRFLDAIPTMHNEGMLAAMATAGTMFPRFGVGPDFVEAVTATAQREGVSPLVTARVLELADRLRRQLVARGAS